MMDASFGNEATHKMKTYIYIFFMMKQSTIIKEFPVRYVIVAFIAR